MGTVRFLCCGTLYPQNCIMLKLLSFRKNLFIFSGSRKISLSFHSVNQSACFALLRTLMCDILLRKNMLRFAPQHQCCVFCFAKTLGQALDRLVSVSSMHYCTSTPDLSTMWSTWGLTLAVGYLILGGASRLDAFSVYPCRTWLPSHATGVTTGAPEVRPSRSSRTKDSSLQISYAHDR